MKKINAKGFAHHVAIMAVLVVAVIGGIGSYIYLNSSSAATVSAATKCKNAGGVYYNNPRIKHSPCWTGTGAYLLSSKNQSYVSATSGQSKRLKNPDQIVVVGGKWKVCDDKVGADICTYAKNSNTSFGKGSHHMNDYGVGTYKKTGTDKYEYVPYYKFLTKNDVYIEKI